MILGFAAVGIGFAASMLGVGGGIFMVPILSIFFVSATQVAVGTSLAAIVLNSISSTIGYGRQRVVDFRLGLMLIPAAIAGSWVGAFLTEFISSEALAVAFAVLLVFVAALMLLGKSPKELAKRFQQETPEGRRVYRPVPVVIVGLVAGVASGFFGIGGGIVMVPAITLLLGASIITAVATSLFVMGPAALIGMAQHAFQGNLRTDLALPLAIGIVVGAQLGSHVATRIPQGMLRRLFGAVMLYGAFNMVWNAVSG